MENSASVFHHHSLLDYMQNTLMWMTDSCRLAALCVCVGRLDVLVRQRAVNLGHVIQWNFFPYGEKNALRFKYVILERCWSALL